MLNLLSFTPLMIFFTGILKRLTNFAVCLNVFANGALFAVDTPVPAARAECAGKKSSEAGSQFLRSISWKYAVGKSQ